MALRDCDSPETVYSGSDAVTRLNVLLPNLWRFSRFTYQGGAYAVDPFTDPPITGASGDQKRAIAFPGNDATVVAKVTDGTYGAATVGYNGGAYNLSFDAYLLGGGTSATLRAGFRASNGTTTITGVSDQAFAVTNVRQTFTWEHISSDDANWYAAAPNNPLFKFFVNSASDIPSGSILYITNIQIQLDDYYAPRDIELPWRPAPREDNIQAYSEYILAANATAIAAKTRYRVMTNYAGTGMMLFPSGLTRVILIDGSSYTVGAGDYDTLLVTTGSSPTSIFVQPASIVDFPTLGRIEVRQGGTGAVTVVPGSGVTFNPPLGGSLTLPGKGAVMQLTKRSTTDIWDVTSPANPIMAIKLECGDETTAITAGTAKKTFRMPFAFTLTGVRASVTAAPTGQAIILDLNEGGVSVLSTKLTIDAGETTSTTAATAAVISDASLADDAEMTIDFDQVGSGTAGAGVKVWLIGYATNTTITGTALFLLEDQSTPILLEDAATALKRES